MQTIAKDQNQEEQIAAKDTPIFFPKQHPMNKRETE